MFVFFLLMSEFDSPVLKPDLDLMLRKSEMKRQAIPLSFSQVMLLLEAIFQRHALMRGENRARPG